MSQLNPAETLRCYFVKIHLNSAVACSLTFLTYPLCVLLSFLLLCLKSMQWTIWIIKVLITYAIFSTLTHPLLVDVNSALSTLSHKLSVRNLPLPCELKFHTTTKTGNGEFSLLLSFSLLHRRTCKSFKTRKQVRFQKFSFVSDFSLI
jgi:hypothetical protein